MFHLASRVPVQRFPSFYNVLTRVFLLPVSEQLIIYQVGILPSQFYMVLADKDYPAFRNLITLAILLILLNSTVGPFLSYLLVFWLLQLTAISTSHSW